MVNGAWTLGGGKSEVHPRRDRCALSEDSRPVLTPSVKRTPTTESLVEPETERRAVYGTPVGKLLSMCHERAVIMYGVKETERKSTCCTEGDEMNVKRIARNFKGVPIAKCVIEINRFPPFVNVYPDSEWAGQRQTCKSTSGGVTQWWNDTLCLVKNTTVSELEFCRSRIKRSDHWFFRRDGDNTSLERTGIRGDTREPCRLSICECMGIQTRSGTDETCNAEFHVRARRRGKEANDICPRKHEFEKCLVFKGECAESRTFSVRISRS